jgi:anti-sigma-K factor RskA
MSPGIDTNRKERFGRPKEAIMQGHGHYRRLLAAIGAVAVLAVSAPSFASARIHQPPKIPATLAHPTVKVAAAVQLVSLGYGCGDLEVFVVVQNGDRSLPMC